MNQPIRVGVAHVCFMYSTKKKNSKNFVAKNHLVSILVFCIILIRNGPKHSFRRIEVHVDNFKLISTRIHFSLSWVLMKGIFFAA